MTELADLDFEKFRAVVQDEVRRGSNLSADDKARLERIHEELQQPDVLFRWITVLNQLKGSAERQLGQRKMQDRLDRVNLPADKSADAHNQYLRWRISILRFLIGLEDRLAVARAARHQHFPHIYPEQLVAERNDVSEQLLWVIQQVRAHRDATANSKLAPSDADINLWSSVLDPPEDE